MRTYRGMLPCQSNRGGEGEERDEAFEVVGWLMGRDEGKLEGCWRVGGLEGLGLIHVESAAGGIGIDMDIDTPQQKPRPWADMPERPWIYIECRGRESGSRRGYPIAAYFYFKNK